MTPMTHRINDLYAEPEETRGGGSLLFDLVTDPFLLYPTGLAMTSGRSVFYGKNNRAAYFRNALSSDGFVVPENIRTERQLASWARNRSAVTTSATTGELITVRGEDVLGQAKKRHKAGMRAIVGSNPLTAKGRAKAATLAAHFMPGMSGTRAAVTANIGRLVKWGGAASLLTSVMGFGAEVAANKFKEYAMTAKSLREDETLNPNAHLVQGQEAYTQRQFAAYTMQNLPGFMQRQGYESRMHHR